jgi:translation initiation factor IF-3
LGFVESSPKQDGRNMVMVMAPHKTPGRITKVSAATA